eukprot:TRINITY_DN5083_c0_g1_i1.p1 TRINITY_DN5083_c0_g1~~TRINITY_DN5083_c0_g1_i1.p1  ORF type:complete len:151 (+),score=23.21 TRINITY_DN5083_c0_g1_i1:59-454(+)
MEAEKGSGVESGADPREAQYVAQILEAMGVDDYEPQVVRQLMEFSHRYITGVLRDAQSYMEYAGHTELHLEDVKLAIQSRVNYSFTTPPQVSVCSLPLTFSHSQHQLHFICGGSQLSMVFVFFNCMPWHSF